MLLGLWGKFITGRLERTSQILGNAGTEVNPGQGSHLGDCSRILAHGRGHMKDPQQYQASLLWLQYAEERKSLIQRQDCILVSPHGQHALNGLLSSFHSTPASYVPGMGLGTGDLTMDK